MTTLVTGAAGFIGSHEGGRLAGRTDFRSISST